MKDLNKSNSFKLFTGVYNVHIRAYNLNSKLLVSYVIIDLGLKSIKSYTTSSESLPSDVLNKSAWDYSIIFGYM